MARCEPPITDNGADWDNQPMLFACANGVIDLKTGKLRDGKPEDRLILHSPVLFDENARCPRFEKFLVEIFNRDADLIDFVHRAIGYTITGLTTEQVLFLLYGGGANGKSVLLSILRTVLGEYAYNMPFSTVELKDRSSIPNDVAALADKRLVTSAETNDGSRFNEARIKALTGCDPITARFPISTFAQNKKTTKSHMNSAKRVSLVATWIGHWRSLGPVSGYGFDADRKPQAKRRRLRPGRTAPGIR
jgi:putative DNA primase/helicase